MPTSRDYIATLETEVIRLSRRRQLPIWALVAILLPYFAVCWVEHQFPRSDVWVQEAR